MKKLIFVFVALFILVLISGCNARNENTTRFDGGTADITSDEISENSETENSETESEVAMEPTGKLEVTSFDGAFLKTNVAYNVVKGTASSDAYTITINDYKLQKYYPGANQWSYIAARTFGTLNPGWNNYVVKTFDKDGDEIDSVIFSLDYEAPVIPDELPDVGASHWLILILSLSTAGIWSLFRKLRWL